ASTAALAVARPHDSHVEEVKTVTSHGTAPRSAKSSRSSWVGTAHRDWVGGAGRRRSRTSATATPIATNSAAITKRSMPPPTMQDPCSLITTHIVNARYDHEDTIEPGTLGVTPSSADALEELEELAEHEELEEAAPTLPAQAHPPRVSRWPMWILGLVIMIDQVD